MRLNPYLRFNGQCAEAFKLYASVLGGNIDMMMRYGESPVAGDMPAETHDRVMHCSMTAGTMTLMGADGPPTDAISNGCAVMLGVDTPEEAERVFAALSEGGSSQMPMQQTFWSVRFGMVTDRFGTPWMVNCDRAPA